MCPSIQCDITAGRSLQSFAVRHEFHIDHIRLCLTGSTTDYKQTMPTYKLIYFNISGLAEPIRYLFHYCGIKFEDERVTFDDWPQLKSGMPLGQVPVLEIDGKRYNQSRAIARYLAKKCNLYGSDEIEALEIDRMVDSLEDMRQPLSLYYWEKDSTCKEKLKQIAFEKLPVYLAKFEEQVKKNGGYFVCGKLTWVDIMYAAYNEMLNALADKDIHKDYPELKKLVDKVNTLPNIKAYREKRPKTLF